MREYGNKVKAVYIITSIDIWENISSQQEFGEYF